MAEHSAMFQRFAASVAGKDDKWREDLDKDAFDALDKKEQREAQELVMRTFEDNDTRGPAFLADVECRGAVAPMKRALPNASGSMKVAIALALETLDVDTADATLVEVLQSGDSNGGLLAISEIRTRDFTDEVIKTLAWACMRHPDASVRKSAGSILIYRSGVTDDPFALSFRPIYLTLGSEDIDKRREAFRDVCEIARFPPNLADTL